MTTITPQIETLLAAIGRSNYAFDSSREADQMPRLIYGGKQRRSPLYWDGETLSWQDESTQALRTAHVRPDGRVEVREYFAPRELTVESVERDVFAALNHGSDARWERCKLGGQAPWPSDWVTERDSDGHARRLDYRDSNGSQRCAGVIVQTGVWTIKGESVGWSYPYIGGERHRYYSHPYRGEVK